MTFVRTKKRLVYEVDFTSLATTDLTTGGDGEVTIDGNTWHMFRGNGGSVDITNGTGLVFTNQSSSGSEYTGLFMGMPLDQFGVEGSPDCEVWWDVTASPGIASWANYTALFLGIGDICTSQPTSATTMPKNPVMWWSQSDNLAFSYYGSSFYNDYEAASIVIPRTFRIVRLNGVWNGYHADSVSGWPTSMTAHGKGTIPELVSISEAWGPSIKFYETGTSENVTITVQKMRVFTYG